MTDLFENYTPPWMNDELTMLRDAARRFFTTELAPQQERWEANGIVDRDAWIKTGPKDSCSQRCPSNTAAQAETIATRP